MAMENRFAYRNAGTEKAPVWQEWLAATVADYVFMDATGDKNIKTYVDEKIAALIGGATALIGDPSGKTDMRKMLLMKQLQRKLIKIIDMIMLLLLQMDLCLKKIKLN